MSSGPRANTGNGTFATGVSVIVIVVFRRCCWGRPLPISGVLVAMVKIPPRRTSGRKYLREVKVDGWSARRGSARECLGPRGTVSSVSSCIVTHSPLGENFPAPPPPGSHYLRG